MKNNSNFNNTEGKSKQAKKDAKMQYLRMELENPNTSQFEKAQIRSRLGIIQHFSENDFLNKTGYELRKFVLQYIDEQLNVLRRKNRTNAPFDLLTENVKSIYYLSFYEGMFEDDSFVYYFDDVDLDLDADLDDINGLINALQQINRNIDARLIKSVLKKKKFDDYELEKLQNHFDEIEDELEIDIERFIRENIADLLALQGDTHI